MYVSHTISTLVECCGYLFTYGMNTLSVHSLSAYSFSYLKSEHLCLVLVRFVCSLQERVSYTRKASFALVKAIATVQPKHFPKGYL